MVRLYHSDDARRLIELQIFYSSIFLNKVKHRTPLLKPPKVSCRFQQMRYLCFKADIESSCIQRQINLIGLSFSDHLGRQWNLSYQIIVQVRCKDFNLYSTYCL